MLTHEQMINISGYVIGALGTAIGIYQVVTAQKIRKVIKSHCETQFFTILNLADSLNESVAFACELAGELNESNAKCIDRNCGTKIPEIGQSISQIAVIAKGLKTECEKMNMEFYNQFGEYLCDVDQMIPIKPCLRMRINEILGSNK